MKIKDIMENVPGYFRATGGWPNLVWVSGIEEVPAMCLGGWKESATKKIKKVACRGVYVDGEGMVKKRVNISHLMPAQISHPTTVAEILKAESNDRRLAEERAKVERLTKAYGEKLSRVLTAAGIPHSFHTWNGEIQIAQKHVAEWATNNGLKDPGKDGDA